MGGKGRDREGTRSHFQVGFRTARPLEGTSNDSDIAAREFKSLTPSGSLSASTYTYRLSPVFYVCARIHIYIPLSISLSISSSMSSILGKKIFQISIGYFFSSPLLIKYSLHGRSIFSRFANRIETDVPACILLSRSMENSVSSKRGLLSLFFFLGRSRQGTAIKLIFSDPRRENKSGTDWIEFPALLPLLSMGRVPFS